MEMTIEDIKNFCRSVLKATEPLELLQKEVTFWRTRYLESHQDIKLLRNRPWAYQHFLSMPSSLFFKLTPDAHIKSYNLSDYDRATFEKTN